MKNNKQQYILERAMELLSSQMTEEDMQEHNHEYILGWITGYLACEIGLTIQDENAIREEMNNAGWKV